VLEEGVRALAKGRNFAALTTLLPDGQPMTHVMWIDCDDEHILINTVRGEVVEMVAGPEARAHIDELSMKYNGHEYRNQIVSERVIARVKPLRQRLRTP
jgi:hypothetical protein